jgi:hypothetical protein
LRFVAGDFKDLAQMSDRCFANLATGKKGEPREKEGGMAFSAVQRLAFFNTTAT